MSATAGPASGLTSSTTESWSAREPTPVNHCSGEGTVQARAPSGALPDRSPTSPGASASEPRTTSASWLSTGEVAPVRHRHRLLLSACEHRQRRPTHPRRSRPRRRSSRAARRADHERVGELGQRRRLVGVVHRRDPDQREQTHRDEGDHDRQHRGHVEPPGAATSHDLGRAHALARLPGPGKRGSGGFLGWSCVVAPASAGTPGREAEHEDHEDARGPAPRAAPRGGPTRGRPSRAGRPGGRPTRRASYGSRRWPATSPSVASSPAATSPSAGDGRTT